tara:strand:- start:9074 stop:9724 length:651 start_codon:yes stop_codon:yes gene_type:complete
MPIYNINNKKVLFIHIPKNYGSFIELLLEKLSSTHYIRKNSVFNEELLYGQYMQLQYQHLTSNQIESLTDYKINDFDIVFALLREPIEKLLSEINWRMFHVSKQETYKGKTKDQIIKLIVNRYNSTTYLMRDGGHNRTQLDFINGHIDKIRLFTDLTECVDFLKKELDIDIDIDTTKKTGNASKNYVTKEDIYRLYPNIDLILQDDIDFYNSINNL